MIASLCRIGVIARITQTELTRRKVLHILLLFALIVLASGFFFTEFRLEAKLKLIKDFSLGAMSLFGIVIALLATAQIIPSEIEHRTIYTILAKPVHRFEFLLGKFLGVASVLFMCVAMMTVVFLIVLFSQGEVLIAEQHGYLSQMTPGAIANDVRQTIRDLTAQTYDPRLAQAVLLVFAKVLLVSALALLISTFATSMIFTVATTFMLYLIGQMMSVAREAWMAQDGAAAIGLQWGLAGLLVLVPDFSQYNLADSIAAGDAVPWSLTGRVLVGTLGYLIIYLTAGSLIFGAREL